MSEPEIGQLFIDKYGKTWEYVGYGHVWNSETGYGGWFNGKGLAPKGNH